MLVKETGKPEVYVYRGGTFHWITDLGVFARYGYPNDLLARLAVVRARVVDVPVRAVYDGQRSGIRLWTLVNPILLVLLRSLARRLWQQRLRPLLQGAGRDAPAEGAAYAACSGVVIASGMAAVKMSSRVGSITCTSSGAGSPKFRIWLVMLAGSKKNTTSGNFSWSRFRRRSV